MKKIIFLLLIMFALCSNAHAEINKIIILKPISMQVFDSSNNQATKEVYKGEIFPLVEIATDEVTLKTIYRIDVGDDKQGYVEKSYASIVDYDKEDVGLFSYGEYVNKIKKISDLENELIRIREKINNKNIASPIEYEIQKMLKILDAAKNISWQKKAMSYSEKCKNMYMETRKYILHILDDAIRDPKNISDIIVGLINADPVFDRNDLELAKKSFSIYPSPLTAGGVLYQIGQYSLGGDETYIDKAIESMNENTNNYNNIALYYERIKDDENAIKYLKKAEQLLVNNDPSYLLIKIRLAKIYEKKKDYENAAILYLDLESKYGGFAFKAAFNADQALNNGIEIPNVNWETIVDLYKRSDSIAGYYDAGLKYAQMGSPRNVRLMAQILKEKNKDSDAIEKANILLDEADKLDARLKGHTP